MFINHNVNDGWTPYMGIFSRENAPVHASTSARARAPINSLGKKSLKKWCFWLWGKDNLVQLPEEPSVTRTVDTVCFFGAATEFLKCVCWRTFINKAQFDAGFAHRLKLKDGAVSAIKIPVMIHNCRR